MAEPVSNSQQSELRNAMPFLAVAVAWAMVGTIVCVAFPPRSGSALGAAAWMLGIWAVALADLGALAKLIQALLSIGNRGTFGVIHAFYWGLIKLVCLGLLGILLFKGAVIPASGLLLGLATLIVVPIVGGFIWSQRFQRLMTHA